MNFGINYRFDGQTTVIFGKKNDHARIILYESYHLCKLPMVFSAKLVFYHMLKINVFYSPHQYLSTCGSRMVQPVTNQLPNS